MLSPEKAARCILRASPYRPQLAIVLGSGFAGVAAAVEPVAQFPSESLPGFASTTVDGHAGRIVVGTLAKVPVIVLSGRCHYYEGHSWARIVFPIRVLACCGVKAVLLTNAAGGIHSKFKTGDFMGLSDHLNFMGGNPLRGRVPPGLSRFVDLTEVYDAALGDLLARAGRQAGVRLHFGVYAAVPGPCYETPAEIRALKRLGADAVGMSTVPEAIVARQCQLRVAGLSCITNRAAGLGQKTLSHSEVLAAAELAKPRATALLSSFVSLWQRESRES